MSHTFRDLTIQVLKENTRPLSPDEIWEYARKMSYVEELGSVGKTPSLTISALIYRDIQDNSDKSVFVTDSAWIRPRRFALRKQIEKMKPGEVEALIDEQEASPREIPEYRESDLHRLMAYYAERFLGPGIYTKTINHTESRRGNYGEGQWLHPDMVGCRFSLQDWDEEIYELASMMHEIPITLYSFELKLEIRFANLREAFFQAVSNSSWANEGYLVTARIGEDTDLRDELQRLSTSFGIGVILLNTTSPDESEVLFPAKPKEIIDWTMVKKLSAMNPGFKSYLERIKKDLDANEVRKELYDKVYTTEELISHFQNIQE